MEEKTLSQIQTDNSKVIYDALYELGQHRKALNLTNADTDENGLFEDEAKIRDFIGISMQLNEKLNRARRKNY